MPNIPDSYCEACLDETELLEWDEEYEMYVCEDCWQSSPE